MSGKEKASLVDTTKRRSLNPKNAAITLPPRSYDIDQLHKGLNPAARAKLDRRDKVIATALEEGAVDGTLKEQPRSAMPNHKFVDVENEELGIVERTQVYVEPTAKPDTSEDDGEAAADEDDSDFEDDETAEDTGTADAEAKGE